MASAGWIKLETVLEGDPRVLRMARALDSGTEHNAVTVVLGGLTRLWFLAERYIGDDDVLPFGVDEINQIIGVADFCNVIPVDWLEVIDGTHVKLPNYQVHNGPAMKSRVQHAARQSRYRNASASRDTNVRDGGASPEEKRRDEKRKDIKPKSQRRGSRIDEWAPNDIDAEFCSALGLHTKQTYAKFRDYWIAKPGQAGVKLDWPATWRNWCRAEAERGAGGQSKLTNGARDAAAWAELIAIATGYDYRLPGKGESLGAYKTALEHHKAAPSTTPLALRQGLAGLRAKLTGAP